MRVDIQDKEIFMSSFTDITNGLNNIKVEGISIDSRNIKKGDMFLALQGEKTDGHNYINQAYKSGACLAIIEKDIKHKLPTYKVSSVINFITQLSSTYRGSINCTIIGITGSNGKTTTKDLLVHILSQSKKVSFTKGNYNSTLGAPLSLFECNRTHDYAIIEMGASKPGEIEYICDIVKPEIGIITNISGAHLENFGSINKIVKTKSSLFSKLPKSGIAFINTDDSYIKNIPVSSEKITYSLYKFSDFIGYLSDNKNNLKINNTDISLNFSSKIISSNILGAFAIASTIGINEKQIKKSIESFQITAGRGNVLKIKDINIIDDTYNANFESAKYGIENLIINFKENRKIVVIGDMLELGSDEKKYHQNLGAILLKYDIFAVFSFGELSKNITNVLEKSSVFNKHYKNKQKLIIDLKKILIKEDIVYLKGSRAMKMEEIIEGLKK
jgi:UDP-N-acetylmuramoyl-tripeptide--D-alanyl-D-alanine ligase